MIPFDAEGRERLVQGRFVSQQVQAELSATPITDVFVFSHGWRGDVPAAIAQYDAWVATMAKQTGDIEMIKELRPDFLPLLVGLHWPSLPFGDEDLAMARVGATDADRTASVERQVDLFAERIANNRQGRAALRVILSPANEPAPEALPRNVEVAFKNLQNAAGLRSGASSKPGCDCEPFDPSHVYGAIQGGQMPRGREPSHVGSAGDMNVILEMLGYLSFWKMKDRARAFGETGGHQFLRSLQRLTAQRPVRFHLMGHSFGCIVVSGCVAGPPGSSRPIPLQSLCLVQGALSIWAYCTDIERGISGEASGKAGSPGYFRPLLERGLVRGPILTTQSEHDSAVGTWYPRAAWLGRQVAMGRYDRYAGLGADGIQGPGCDVTALEIGTADTDYDFKAGKIYNINCSRVICNGNDGTDAHSDICHPEIAHAIWQAAAAGLLLEPTPPVPDPTPTPRPPSPKPAPIFPRQPVRRILKKLIDNS